MEIKTERITNQEKPPDVRAELAVLTEARARTIFDGGKLAPLVVEPRSANESLWQIEEDIRACENAHDFGSRFVELARWFYGTNDRRAALERQVNERLGAEIVEEKSYIRSGDEQHLPVSLGDYRAATLRPRE